MVAYSHRGKAPFSAGNAEIRPPELSSRAGRALSGGLLGIWDGSAAAHFLSPVALPQKAQTGFAILVLHSLRGRKYPAIKEVRTMIFRRNSRKPEPILILPARCAVTGSPFAVRLVVKDGRMVAQEGRKVFP